jgi:hypothetical protein
MSPSRRVSCAAASPQTPIMSGSRSLVRSAARSAMSFAVPLCRGHHRAAHRSHDERGWWRQAGIDPIKVARRLWKETHGIGRRRPQRPALRRPHGVATSSDPKNEDMSATATPQEEPRLSDLPE